MAQISVVVTSAVMLAALGALAYVHATRDGEQATPVPAVPAATATVRSSTDMPSVAEPEPVRTAEAAPAQPSSAPQTTTADIGRWISETQSNDAKTRAAAIEALANAPKAQAVPALERVLESGEPQVDRQIALRSLHVLALNDGDDSGSIRDVIRHAIYHSDDENVTQTAQALLEDIETEFAERGKTN